MRSAAARPPRSSRLDAPEEIADATARFIAKVLAGQIS